MANAYAASYVTATPSTYTPRTRQYNTLTKKMEVVDYWETTRVSTRYVGITSREDADSVKALAIALWDIESADATLGAGGLWIVDTVHVVKRIVEA